ncbi:beta-ketoacyl synthase N-terminal-like domain-containing protein [Pseudomonas asplenii]|nr:beta-ketoacyl synthase N-terminal-like domain-containing protein [Pseudomonas fuscovaginae]
METMNRFEDEEQWLGKAAIVGMSCRFPGASDVRRYWTNLLEGVESVERFDPMLSTRSRFASNELPDGGVVGAEAVMPDVDAFDYELFGYTLGEARRLDPQMRIALQCAHEALEDAGCAGMKTGDGKVGVFFSASMSTYLLEHLLEENMDGLGALLGNDKDHIATTIAFRLGLTGAAVSVGSGCSSSAAALHFACLALATYQCDVAVVGGASIIFPQRQGHVYREGGVYSKDGHCRPFSADATGTVGGSGVGVVVLRRLDDAVRDNHSIYCAIAGSACGNDGRRKVGYAAPSVEGQVETIRLALATAQADPKAFAFIEAHATGTALGDPIELDALHRAFGATSDHEPYCALGSVKANIGHLDSASGIASVIKAALCVSERKRPAQIGFREGHPLIPWKTSPFHVVPSAGALFDTEQARYVGVNSLGMGGTNVFVVLEPAPEPVPRLLQAPPALPILLSAHRPEVLEEVVKALQVFVMTHRPDLADLAYTLSVGRKCYDCRAAFICTDLDDLLLQLEQGRSAKVAESELESRVSAWLVGEAVDFSDLFPANSRRLHLPAYPYRRTECRVERSEAPRASKWWQVASKVPDVPLPPQDPVTERLVEDYSAGLIRDFLLDRVTALSADPTIERAQLIDQLGLDPDYQRFGEYLVESMLARGLLLGEQSMLQASALMGLPQSSQLAASVLERCPARAPLVRLLADLAEQRASIMCQGCPALEVLAEQGMDRLSQAIGSDVQRNAIVADQFAQVDLFLRRFCAELGRPLRILEIGCGHLALTQHLLAAPNTEHLAEYWISDESQSLVERARERLEEKVQATLGQLRFARFDIDRRPAAQSIPVDHFDVVIGFNVLHVATNLQAALANLGELINDQGVLCQIDSTDSRLSTQLIWGMLAQWWRYEDKRAHGPLLSVAGYQQLLASACGEYLLAGSPSQETESLLWWGRPNPYAKEHTYIPQWRRFTGACEQRWPTGDVVLAFVDDATLRRGIENLAEESQAKVLAVVSAASDALSPEDHIVSMGNEEHVRLAIDACLRRHGRIDRVVYAWTRPVPGGELEAAVTTSLGTLHWTAKILDQMQGDKSIEWLVISRGLFRVAGNEPVYASQSLAYDMSKMIELEYPQFHLRHVELPADGALPPAFATACTCANVSGTLAVRGRYLWQPYHAQVDLSPDEPDLDGAVLVLVGGLGGIGLTVAQALVRRFAVHLVILHRAQWLDRPESENDERQVAIRRQLATIRGQASSLQLEQLDANDREAVFAAARRIGERHSKIDGVLYLAGEIDREGVLRNRSFSMLERSIRTKTHGVTNVTEAFAHLRPDFHVNFSSIGAVLHKAKFGEAGYVIGNGYLNAHARAGAADSTCRFICINWTDWQTDGMWAYAQSEFQSRYRLNDEKRESTTDTWGDSHWLQSVSARQGVETLLRVIASDHEEVVVCAQDLPSLMAYQQQATHADYGRYLDSLKLSAAVQPGSREGGLAFVSHDTARSLAQIWEELLGVAVQGNDDNFYSAGGDSLLALRLSALVKQAHGVDLSLSTLLDTLTFGALVAYIDMKIAEKAPSSEVGIEL